MVWTDFEAVWLTETSVYQRMNHSTVGSYSAAITLNIGPIVIYSNDKRSKTTATFH